MISTERIENIQKAPSFRKTMPVDGNNDDDGRGNNICTEENKATVSETFTISRSNVVVVVEKYSCAQAAILMRCTT